MVDDKHNKQPNGTAASLITGLAAGELYGSCPPDAESVAIKCFAGTVYSCPDKLLFPFSCFEEFDLSVTNFSPRNTSQNCGKSYRQTASCL